MSEPSHLVKLVGSVTGANLMNKFPTRLCPAKVDGLGQAQDKIVTLDWLSSRNAEWVRAIDRLWSTGYPQVKVLEVGLARTIRNERQSPQVAWSGLP
ncbi:hypothetical protein FNV43_RR21565 [Rhamnella rubrinervis]|uniref:Uncharacterized protein n=1 Tax=Rhamnella rubrinervis TaxID=2594499 RepID=A0A8K0DWV2_9ROSA|nr:hypothetical protein FNV43_RR21565 [Rhamnella rubrinervis]